MSLFEENPWDVSDYEAEMQDRWEPQATMADAHREWHANSGVPMGQPGCPQDACHPDDTYDAEREQAHWEQDADYMALYNPVDMGMYDDDPSPYSGDYSEM